MKKRQLEALRKAKLEKAAVRRLVCSFDLMSVMMAAMRRTFEADMKKAPGYHTWRSNLT